MWIGVLWAGLRVAMWITHVGGQISPWPAGKVTEISLASDSAITIVRFRPSKSVRIHFIEGGVAQTHRNKWLRIIHPWGSSHLDLPCKEKIGVEKLGLKKCDPSEHLQKSPGPEGPELRKKIKRGLFGGLQKSPRKYPKKSENTQNWTLFSDLFGYFRGLFCRPPKRLFLRLFCNFGPGDPCKWSLGSQFKNVKGWFPKPLCKNLERRNGVTTKGVLSLKESLNL